MITLRMFSKNIKKELKSTMKLLKIKRKKKKMKTMNKMRLKMARRKSRRVDLRGKRTDGFEWPISRKRLEGQIWFRLGISQLQILCFFVS